MNVISQFLTQLEGYYSSFIVDSNTVCMYVSMNVISQFQTQLEGYYSPFIVDSNTVCMYVSVLHFVYNK